VPDVGQTNERWKAFTKDRSQAQLEMTVKHSEIERRIEDLKNQISNERRDFARQWEEEKERRKQERDESIKQAWRDGWSGPEILRAMNSNHTKLVYALRDEVLAEGHTLEVEQTPTVEADESIEGLLWETHPHVPTHGWLVSQDRTYYKHWPSPHTWYVADREGHFIAGSREAFDKADPNHDKEQVDLLVSLLDGTYEGPIRLGLNHYTH
jgi:hypothetical protein